NVARLVRRVIRSVSRCLLLLSPFPAFRHSRDCLKNVIVAPWRYGCSLMIAAKSQESLRRTAFHQTCLTDTAEALWGRLSDPLITTNSSPAGKTSQTISAKASEPYSAGNENMHSQFAGWPDCIPKVRSRSDRARWTLGT